MELFGSTSILPLLLGIRRQIQSVLATSRVPIFNSGSPPTSSRNSNCCRSGALPCLATTGLYSLCSSRLFKIAQEIATLGAPKRKAPAGGSGSWGFDLRDKNSSRDRRYNDRGANWFPTLRIELDRLHPFAFAARRGKQVEDCLRSGSSVTRSRR